MRARLYLGAQKQKHKSAPNLLKLQLPPFSTCRFMPPDICCILCVVLAAIKIYFIKQAVDDEPQSNSVANIPAHKL